MHSVAHCHACTHSVAHCHACISSSARCHACICTVDLPVRRWACAKTVHFSERKCLLAAPAHSSKTYSELLTQRWRSDDDDEMKHCRGGDAHYDCQSPSSVAFTALPVDVLIAHVFCHLTCLDVVRLARGDVATHRYLSAPLRHCQVMRRALVGIRVAMERYALEYATALLVHAPPGWQISIVMTHYEVLWATAPALIVTINSSPPPPPQPPSVTDESSSSPPAIVIVKSTLKPGNLPRQSSLRITPPLDVGQWNAALCFVSAASSPSRLTLAPDDTMVVTMAPPGSNQRRRRQQVADYASSVDLIDARRRWLVAKFILNQPAFRLFDERTYALLWHTLASGDAARIEATTHWRRFVTHERQQSPPPSPSLFDDAVVHSDGITWNGAAMLRLALTGGDRAALLDPRLTWIDRNLARVRALRSIDAPSRWYIGGGGGGGGGNNVEPIITGSVLAATSYAIVAQAARAVSDVDAPLEADQAQVSAD